MLECESFVNGLGLTIDRPARLEWAAATFSACVIGQMVDVWHLLDTPASPWGDRIKHLPPEVKLGYARSCFPTRIASVCIQPGMKHVYSTWSVESMSPVWIFLDMEKFQDTLKRADDLLRRDFPFHHLSNWERSFAINLRAQCHFFWMR